MNKPDQLTRERTDGRAGRDPNKKVDVVSLIRLGHADLQTTLRHYVLAEEETQREAVEALAEVFGV